MKKRKYKNRYSFSEIFKLGYSFMLTKLFYPKAKLICRPLIIRGKKSFRYGKGLSIGYNCRLDLLNTEKVTLFIGENCEINDNCHIVATNKVTIGDNFLCASKVFISDTSHGEYVGISPSSPNEKPRDRKWYSKPVNIGNNVWVGENVVILPGVAIGNGCIIGANSTVTKSIPDYCIAVGSPAKVIKKFNFDNNRWEKFN